MYCIDSYKDLCTEIEIYKDRINNLKEQKKIMLKLMDCNRPKDIAPIDYSGMPHGSKNFMSLDRIWEDIKHIENMLYLEITNLEHMEETKAKINSKLNGLEGLQYKVEYKHSIEGKTLQQIADELGYSYDHIRRIHSKCHNEATDDMI